MPAQRSWPAVGENVWARIRDEFGLRTGDEVEAHFEALYGDADPYLQQAVRVFIGDEAFFPGFQFHEGVFHPTVLALFRQAVDLKVPHNVFAAWMVTPLRAGAQRPVDGLENPQILAGALDDFAHGREWVPPWAAVPPQQRRPSPGPDQWGTTAR